MKIAANIFIAALAFSFVACTEGEKENVTGTEAAETTFPAANSNQNFDQTTTIDASPAETSTNTAASGQMLNPPHGEPGHDCALPVGAPLKGTSATNNTAQPNTSAQPQPTNTVQPNDGPILAPTLPTAPTQNSNSTASVNPPHGQPGHDCAVPVGAPLNR